MSISATGGRRGPSPAALLLALALALCCVVVVSRATPRHAARYGQHCGLCHDDPSGGGKRSLYAAQYLLPVEMVTFPPDTASLARLDPRLGENLSVGCDLRTLHHYASGGDPRGFLQMEGNVYLAFDPDPRVALYVARGISGSYEVFGLARLLPAQGYLKAGRFVPPYGWRLADHTAFVREHGGFAPPAHSDVGLEAGVFPGPFSVQVAAVNGARGRLRDADGDLAVSGLLLGRFRLAGLALAAGGSLRLDPRDAARESRSGGGPCAGLHRGRWTWVGEMDWLRRERAGAERTEWMLSHELSARLERGVDALVTYDFHDPDLDLRTGARERWGAGAEWRPSPFVQLRLMIHRLRASTGGSTPGAGDEWLSEAQVHFLY